METILFLADAEPSGFLDLPALQALTSAKTLAAGIPGAKLIAGLVGEHVQAAADAIACSGPEKFLGAAAPELAQARYATDAAAAEAVCKAAQATLVVAAATSRWNRVLPGVAQRLSGRVDSHVINVSVSSRSVTITRWYYRQRMEATLKRAQRPWFILIDPGSQPAWQGQPGAAQVQPVPVTFSASTTRTTVLGIREPAGDAQTIRPEAKLLLVVGAGWTKKQADGQTHEKEAEKLLLDCLRLARASLGSSKSLVDLGAEGQSVLSFLTHMNQVGQTGSTPRHPKGLATCCHGEEPHTVGWRFINERRAVNLDPNCGWARGKADVLYVADAFAVLSKVNELLARS